MAELPDIPSPCIGVCVRDPATGYCTGCMRTIQEIAGWSRMDNQERLGVVRELRNRRIAAGRTSESDGRPRRRRTRNGL